MIIIVDYKMGNTGSILNMLRRIGAVAKISSEPEEIMSAEKLILPGVGAFDKGMSNLQQSGLFHLLKERVLKDKIPILGICLGMQLLTINSEEGRLSGFGWIDAQTIRFKFDEACPVIKVPHMGWNSVSFKQSNDLSKEFDEDPRFYFVHSYHVVCNKGDNILAKTLYGYEFTSIIQNENIYGVQFHPEKSHKYGLRLLKNFVNLS